MSNSLEYFIDFSEIEDYYSQYPEMYYRPTDNDLNLETDVNKIPNPLQQPPSPYRSNCVEFWKPITDKEFPGIDPERYYISSFGNTWDCKLNKPMSIVCSKGNKYYVQANVHSSIKSSTPVKIHRMVLLLFSPIENPDQLQVNHIDGTHNNNVLYNLEWCDDSYNRMHSIINGVGTNNFYHDIILLTPEEVHKIKVLREDMGIGSKDIYYKYMPELQEKSTYDAIRHLIPRIAAGGSKLYSRYYC